MTRLCLLSRPMRPVTIALLALTSSTYYAGAVRAEGQTASAASSPSTEANDGEPPPVWDPTSGRPPQEENAAPASASGAETAQQTSGPNATSTPSGATSAPTKAAPAEPAFAAALEKGDWWSTIGINVTAGLAFGGDTLAELTYADGSTSGVQAGEGISLTGGLTWTPFWFAKRFGLGVGLEGGWKYKSTSVQANGSVQLERFPLTGSVRGLFAFTPTWHALVAGGPVLELSPRLSGDGVVNLDVPFDDALGGMLEVGVLTGHPLGIGAEITFRYTFLSYNFMGQSADASSAAILFRLFYFL